MYFKESLKYLKHKNFQLQTNIQKILLHFHVINTYHERNEICYQMYKKFYEKK